MGCTIIGCGKSLPKLDVSNDDLAKLVDTSDEWIVQRTGIKSRRICVDETGLDLCEEAARAALGWSEGGYSERRVDPLEIDLVICATTTPDTLIPSQAALVCRKLGLANAAAFDMNAACSGFVYAVSLAETMMAAGAPGAPGAARRNPIRRALLLGSERISRITNWDDRSTCVLFGDGAGAVVLEWDEERPGILGSYLAYEDDTTNALTCSLEYTTAVPFAAEGLCVPAPEDLSAALVDAEIGTVKEIQAGEPRQVLRMDGPKVFKFAAEAMSTAVERALERANVSADEVACFVPHQANERIIKYAAKKMKQPLERFQLSIAHRGNSSAACVPSALADAYEAGRIARGDKVVLVAFGGGFTSAAIVYEA